MQGQDAGGRGWGKVRVSNSKIYFWKCILPSAQNIHFNGGYRAFEVGVITLWPSLYTFRQFPPCVLIHLKRIDISFCWDQSVLGGHVDMGRASCSNFVIVIQFRSLQQQFNAPPTYLRILQLLLDNFVVLRQFLFGDILGRPSNDQTTLIGRFGYYVEMDVRNDLGKDQPLVEERWFSKGRDSHLVSNLPVVLNVG